MCVCSEAPLPWIPWLSAWTLLSVNVPYLNTTHLKRSLMSLTYPCRPHSNIPNSPVSFLPPSLLAVKLHFSFLMASSSDWRVCLYLFFNPLSITFESPCFVHGFLCMLWMEKFLELIILVKQMLWHATYPYKYRWGSQILPNRNDFDSSAGN